MSDEHLNPNIAFENAARAYELQTHREEVLASVRLSDMRTNSVEQYVLTQRLTNLLKVKSITEFESAITRFRSRRKVMEKEANRLHKAQGDLAFYKLGDKLPGIVRQNIWSAFTVLSVRATYATLLSWTNTPFTNSPTYWIGRTLGEQSTIPATFPSDRNTVAGLLYFQQENHATTIVRGFTPAWTATMRAFSDMDNGFKVVADRYQADLDALQKGTYDIWKPADVTQLSLPASG